MATKCTACLIGPKSAGKSSLLQTFTDCMMEMDGHGFASDRKINVRSIDAAEFEAGESVMPILGGHRGNYQQYRSNFFVNPQATYETVEFFFRLTTTGSEKKFGPGGEFENPILLRVVNSAGEDAVFEDYGDAEVQRSPDSKKKLEDALAQAEAVIIVVPLVDLQRAGFQGPLSRLISNLVTSSTRNADNKPHRIVVAFTHYERLFVRAGREAFGIATQKTVARNVILHALDQSQWAGDLRSFSAQPGRKVYFTVTSSYGFAKGLGIPNVEPHWRNPNGEDLEQVLFGKPSSIPTYWRPFLTAEPFICAAMDEPGAYTFTFDSLRGDEPPPPLPSRPPPRPENPTRGDRPKPLSGLTDFFNRRRDEEGTY